MNQNPQIYNQRLSEILQQVRETNNVNERLKLLESSKGLIGNYYKNLQSENNLFGYIGESVPFETTRNGQFANEVFLNVLV